MKFTADYYLIKYHRIKKFIKQARSLYKTHTNYGSKKKFLELVDNHISYNEINLKFPDKKIKKEFQTLLNRAFDEFETDKDVYFVSRFIDDVEQIINLK